MAELWQRYKPNDVLWHCPILGCGHDNIDDPAETTLPMCERCGECFEWSQITIKTTVADARARHKDAQAIASDWKAVGDDMRRAMGIKVGGKATRRRTRP